MKIGFLPIDNRPVCYTLPVQIARLDRSIEFFIPERKLLGDLTMQADISGLFKWLENLPECDAIVLSLDTIAYGGLIPSRRSPETFEEIKDRIERLKEILATKHAKIYAFSSIMRISNNNINEEEKEYWARWGKRIFDYSYQTHKLGCESCIANIIPSEILDDYISTRKRNFEINKIYLEWQKERLLDTLVFSKDDCAEYGFNVQEAKALEALDGFTKTGADEIPLTLLARAINKPLKIAPVFAAPGSRNLISNYEDVPVETSVKGQIELAGCSVAEVEEADIILYVNNFEHRQGEIVMGVDTKPFDGIWEKPDKPYMIADVRFANGADNAFVEQIINSGYDRNFYGYSGWNTTANTLGSLICAGKIRFCAGDYNENAFKALEAIRLLDDWAYQANTRQMRDIDLKHAMYGYEERVNKFLGTNFAPEYKFPWNRRFEVEVTL